MTAAYEVTCGHAGWIEDDAGRRSLFENDAARAALDPVDVAQFPGRWSPRRAVPEECAPLIGLVGQVLESAGWWERGSGEFVDGGLVVACDGLADAALVRFAGELRADPALVGPAGFLRALPSTTASVVGLLWGLRDYHATVVDGARSGIGALRHALDLLELRRLDRVVVAALSVVEEDLALGVRDDENSRFHALRLASVLCVNRSSADAPGRHERRSRHRVGFEIGLDRPGEAATSAPFVGALPAACRAVGAVPLVLASTWLGGGVDSRPDDRVRFVGEDGWLSVERREP